MTLPTTTSTTLLCSDPICFFDQIAECDGQQLPAPLRHRLTRVFNSLTNARQSSSRQTKRLYGRVRRGLTQAASRVKRYATPGKPLLTPDCALALESSLDALVVDVAAECTSRGFCTPQ